VDALRTFYLAGGSAIAVHLGHRRSDDLDMFSRSADVDIASVEVALRHVPGIRMISVRAQIGDVPVDIVRYPYPLLEETIDGPLGVAVAGLLDLAVMKLATVASRGLKRDFWDLEVIATQGGITLARACEAYVDRFGKQRADLYHVIRALTYFDDADGEPSPRGLSARRWQAIRDFFEREAPTLLEGAVR
jgi:hypothetical protein